MTIYTVRLASRPDLNGDFDPRTAPVIGTAETVRDAVALAKAQWQPGYAYTVRRSGKLVQTIWEDGSIS